MVAKVCIHCGSESLVKDGRSRSRKQQYRCRSCGRRSTENPQSQGHSEEFKAQVLALYFERPSMRGIQRATGVSRQTLTVWLKKDCQMRQETPQYLEATLLPPQSDDVLELDELWSFVGSKKKVVWLWMALCRRTRQVVAWHFGDRSAATCRALWRKVPASYRDVFCYSDLWEAYQKVLPPEQHQACGKEEGQTNHLERFNLTLRQRIGRLVRKTLSFSKSYFMHIVVFRLFLVLYNSHKAQRLMRSVTDY